MIHWLNGPDDPLPDTRLALDQDSGAPGLLAAGGELTLKRLQEAYSRGVFPWYSSGPTLWWSPDPRMVLITAEFKLSRSLRKTAQRFAASANCELRIDSAFQSVIGACSATPRAGQDGTWIVPEMVEAYCNLHHHGLAHSFETWIGGELVGGLYGISMGRMFFGESMFSHRTDASKIALTALVCFCRQHGVEMIDCQQRTEHLSSMGGRELARVEFETKLVAQIKGAPIVEWFYDLSMWRHLSATPSSTNAQERLK
jgi:leucyl/phenylalanyl-tRNA---protein transferase